MNLRRATIQALIVSLIGSVWWSWSALDGASDMTFMVMAVIIFGATFAFRLILDVGGALLEDERRRNRAAGMDDRWPWT